MGQMGQLFKRGAAAAQFWVRFATQFVVSISLTFHMMAVQTVFGQRGQWPPMTNRVGGLKMQFFHAPLVCAFLSDSFGRRQDGEEHCPPSVTFAACVTAKCKRIFITQQYFSSSLSHCSFLAKRTL